MTQGNNAGRVGSDVVGATVPSINVQGGARPRITLTGVGGAARGSVTLSGLTMSTARLLGRSAAGTGAIEEITLGTNLSFTGTTLNASGSDATNLGYTPATRVLTSSTGTGVTLPLADGTNPGLMASADFTKLFGIATGAEVNVNADWTAGSGDAQILNKPTLGTLAAQNGTFSGTSSGTNTGDQELSGLLVKASNLSDLVSASTARTNLGLGSLATQSGTFSGTSSGTNTGDQTIALTGEATGSGTGSFAVTVTNASVIGKVLTGFISGAGVVSATDSILQAIQKIVGNLVNKAATGAVGSSGLTMATARLLGRSTAGTGAIEEITLGTDLSFTGTTLNATVYELPVATNTVLGGVKVGDGLSITPEGLLSAISSDTGKWTWRNTAQAGDPGSGRIGSNTLPLSTTPYIHLSAINANGVDVTAWFYRLSTGDILALQDQDDSSNVIRYNISAEPINNNTWWRIPVTLIEDSGTAPNNNAAILVYATFSGAPPATMSLGPPATASDPGTAGEIRYEPGYIYVCVATDTWQRAPLSSW